MRGKNRISLILWQKNTEAVLPAPVLFLLFLLFQFKLASGLRFLFLSAHGPSVSLHLLLLQFQGLLGFGSHARILKFPSHLTLDALWIYMVFLYSSCHSRTEPQTVVIFHKEFLYLIIPERPFQSGGIPRWENTS